MFILRLIERKVERHVFKKEEMLLRVMTGCLRKTSHQKRRTLKFIFVMPYKDELIERLIEFNYEVLTLAYKINLS
jgi:hypothetical protein